MTDKAPRDLDAILRAVLPLAGAHHLAQLILLGELPGENAKVLDQLVAGCDHRFLRGDFTVSLNAEFKLGNQGMRNL